MVTVRTLSCLAVVHCLQLMLLHAVKVCKCMHAVAILPGNQVYACCGHIAVWAGCCKQPKALVVKLSGVDMAIQATIEVEEGLNLWLKQVRVTVALAQPAAQSPS